MPELKRGNPKAFETIGLKLKALAGLTGRVGWFEDSKYDDGTPVAYVAALNELGHGKTPPRPFMRPTAIAERDAWIEVAARGARAVVAGSANPRQVMEQLTSKAEADVRDAILALTEPALSPITIELRAMKKRDPNLRVTGATVGEAARKVAQPGYVTPNVSTKPLIDTDVMERTLTSKVESSQ